MGTKTTVAAERCAATSRRIAETRARIATAAGTLQNQLKPSALLRPARTRLLRPLGEGGEKILDSFRENPIPLTLTGIGLGWLILRDLLPRKEAGATAGEAVGKTREAAQKVREGVRKTSDWFSRTLDENPLLIALGVLAAGMAAGLSFPAGKTTAGKIGEPAAESGYEVLETVEDAPPSSGLSPGPQSSE